MYEVAVADKIQPGQAPQEPVDRGAQIGVLTAGLVEKKGSLFPVGDLEGFEKYVLLGVFGHGFPPFPRLYAQDAD